MAVVVIISEGGTRPPASGVSYSGCRGDIGERAIAIVVVEHARIEIRNIKVFPAIIVVVADGGAKSPTAMREPSLGGHIGKSAVVVIVIELARMALLCLQILQRGAVHQEDVHPPVVVVVKDCDSAAHGFHDVMFFRAAAGEVEIDAGGAGYVCKRHRGGGRLLFVSARSRQALAI